MTEQNPTLTAEVQKRETNRFLLAAAYITIAAIGAAGVLEIRSFWARWGSVALLVAFGALMARTPDEPEKRGQAQIFIALQTLAITILLLIQPGSTIFAILFFILSATAMLNSSFRVGAVWILVFTLISGASFVSSYGWGDGLRILGMNTGGYLFFGIVASSLVRSQQAQRKAEGFMRQLQTANDRLEEANRQLQAYTEQIESMVLIEERNRMAREMHDTVGHRLTVSAVQLEGAQRLIPQDPEKAARMVGTVREQVREALHELRSTVARLREPLEADMRLEPALERMVSAFSSATGLPIELNIPSNLPALPPLHRQALFRAAQEGLTNIQRHSQAKHAWVSLKIEGGEVCLCVSDDGAGYSGQNERPGFGLLGLQERADQTGGRLVLGERPGGGARMEFYIPLPVEVSHA